MFLTIYIISVILCLGLIAFDIYRRKEYVITVQDLLTLCFITFVPLVNTFCLFAYGIFYFTEKFRKFNYQHVLWSKKK